VRLPIFFVTYRTSTQKFVVFSSVSEVMARDAIRAVPVVAVFGEEPAK
jgi:hypothetical protein